MRIMIVGGIQQKNAAERFYDVAPKLINGFIRLGHTVFHFSDRDTSRSSNIFKSRKLGIKKCNNELLSRISAFAPHIIIFKHADIIQKETLLTIRQKWPNIKMAQVNVDALFNPDNVERIKNKSGLVDANFITTYGEALNKIKQNNVPMYYIPNPVDASIDCYKAFENETFEHDLFLAYGSGGATDPRTMLSQYIKDNIPNIKFKHCIASEGSGLWGHAYYKTIAHSMAGLNLSRTQEKNRLAEDIDLFMYSSDRISHYVGNGLLTFTDAQFSLDKLFTADEMVFYKNKEDLVAKLTYYLENKQEGREIARAGWQKAHKLYNGTEVSRFIIETLMGENISQTAWPKDAYQ